MKSILRTCYAKPLAGYLIIALIALSTFAGPAEAMFVPAAAQGDVASAFRATSDRAADLGRIQSALETKIVRQKLMDYGLSPTEALAKMNMLSDQQLHMLATHTDAVQAGGHAADVFFGLVIVGLLVVVLIYLLQGRVEVR